MATETPKFKILKSSGKCELRSYAKSITASVLVDATEHGSAGSEAFGVLADYIFGNNTSRASIAMTAPVASQQLSSEKIAMTAPVSSSQTKTGQYSVSFTMPSSYSLSSLPKPNSSQVIIASREPYQAVVIKFSGYTSEAKINKKSAELKAWADSINLAANGPISVLRYDAPYKPGFLRHNEISIQVDESKNSSTQQAKTK
jgi:hypothetical protein